MFHLKNFFTLIERDFIEFFSGKTWIIVLILPLFITFLYAVIYRQAESKNFTIGYYSELSSSVKTVLSAPQLKLNSYQNEQKAKNALIKGEIDGLILDSAINPSGSIRLLVDKTKLKESTLIVNSINVAILQSFSPKSVPRIDLVYQNKAIQTRWVSFPIWLIQIVLTVCLLQAAAAISDEKERQTFHALLVSPMTLTDYLLAKLGWNTIIGTSAVLLSLLLTGASINIGTVIIFTILGCMIYSAISILIGLFSPGALFARTIATLAYIISALPMMIKDLSFNWKGLLTIFPSYLILYGFERSLLPNPINDLASIYGMVLLLEIIFSLIIINYILKYKADF